jgi:hypothetical protein
MEDVKKKDVKGIWKGIGITVLLHFLLVLVPSAIFFIGIAQLIYIVPATVIAFSKGKRAIGQGILIGAGITFLVNTACFGAVMSGWFY